MVCFCTSQQKSEVTCTQLLFLMIIELVIQSLEFPLNAFTFYSGKSSHIYFKALFVQQHLTVMLWLLMGASDYSMWTLTRPILKTTSISYNHINRNEPELPPQLRRVKLQMRPIKI